MPRLFFLCLCIFASFLVFGQKPPIGPLANLQWAQLGHYQLSNDGRYLGYDIWGEDGIPTVVLASVNGRWKKELPHASLVGMTRTSDAAIVMAGDSIVVMHLGAVAESSYLFHVTDVVLIKANGNSDLLCYRDKWRPGELTLFNVGTKMKMVYSDVEKYWTNVVGGGMVLETLDVKTKDTARKLLWLSLASGKAREIWHGRSVDQLIFSSSGGSCVFKGQEKDNSGHFALWRYISADSSTSALTDIHITIGELFLITSIQYYNELSGRVFVKLERPFVAADTSTLTYLPDVWSYKDSKLQSDQAYHLANDGHKSYAAVFDISTSKLTRIEGENEQMFGAPAEERIDHFVLIARTGGGNAHAEWNWNPQSKVSIWLVDLHDGSKKLVDSGLSDMSLYSYSLSYNEHYVIYYDPVKQGYFSFRIRDGNRRRLTQRSAVQWSYYESKDEPKGNMEPYRPAAVIRNTDAILVYSQTDIFILDPDSVISCKNLTAVARKGNDLVYRLLPEHNYGRVIEPSERLVLSVFSRSSKDAGFSFFRLDATNGPTATRLQPYHFDDNGPTKARDTDFYVVGFMSAAQNTNVAVSKDLLSFNTMTDVHPERKYNWMTAELVTWRTFDGQIDQGILYKPEDFTTDRQYPMIVHYYERMSDQLHNFLKPGPSDGELNIPLYVSNGYLVFVPDIYYRVGYPGASAYSCVVSGVRQLLTRGFVDRRRIGLQGHSFGGFETNYIISHSHLFAAAMSAAGMSDFVSAYGSLIGDGSSRQRQYELYRDRIGTTLWANTQLYLDNSPVLRADKISTPLLMMANKNDGDVPWQQGIELFTALRRLRKPVWLLQYDGQGHNVGDQSGDDFTLRMYQFFNYYLKGGPAPLWMTRGIPAEQKGRLTGLEPDTSGAKP